jgi:hypothetical protein
MITAYHIPTRSLVQILDVQDGIAEVITLDGSTPFAVESSSQARKYGAPPIAHLTGAYVPVSELSGCLPEPEPFTLRLEQATRISIEE